jgi:DNA-binding MarR family transcriptional regulator
MDATEPQQASLALALLRASDWFNNALVRHLADSGWPLLTRTQSLTFATLGPAGARPADLARTVGISRQSMQKVLEELQAAGLVETRPDPVDRRAKLVTVSPRGQQMVEQAKAVLEQLEAELNQRIGPEHVAGLRRALEADWGSAPAVSDRSGEVAASSSPR